MITGYTNPMRSMERKLAPDYAAREFRDPGLRMPHAPSGLGSLRHTMPHLRMMNAGARHFQGGGPNLVAQAYARPNPSAADARFRALHNAIMSQSPFNPVTRELPMPTYAYQEGGEADDQEQDPREVMNPEDQQSESDDNARQIVLEALAALEGRHPDAKAALGRFIDAFGPRALADLQQMAEEQHQRSEEDEQGQDEQEGEDESEPEADGGDDLAGAGGGLLEGPGTGQSDEIEGTTPSGRPVLLSDGEYVIDAPTVAALGDGSSSAGARRLDELRRQIRRDAWGHEKQAKPMSKGGAAIVLKLP